MKKTIKKGVTLNCIQSDKFKDICISVNFFAQINERNATERALLSMMLADRCALYDTKKKMNEACDHLYGCTLGSRVLSYGQLHCIELRSKIINPVYISENHNILDDWINLLKEVIFSPLMIQGQFSADLFEENRRVLAAKIMRKMDDPQSYTIKYALKNAGKGQPLAISSGGDEKILQSLNVKDITNQYLNMLKNDRIEMIVCGDIDERKMLHKLSERLEFDSREGYDNSAYKVKKQEYQLLQEEKQQTQSNIAIVCATDISVTESDYSALKVANGIFGQFPSSYLFQVVREQHSLCYSIFSSLISYDGACVITTGVEKKNMEKAMSLIEEQLERCRKGDISEELLATTKQILCNTLIHSADEMTSIIGYNLGNAILNRNYSIEENIRDVSKVTVEDCVRVFNKMEMITGFVTLVKEESYE